jgi:hypothetical protein
MTNKPEEGPHVPDTVALLEAQAKEIAEKDARIAELEAALKESDESLGWLISKYVCELVNHDDRARILAAMNGENYNG